eukprot:CAMPEP_0116825742 /NCGR_PEP_ID=MMETSP0418-20121206/2139_1 /TAXON_ID=1158023 /ORGANISM="Astrosyne radiata, Strain 13vi08-1A" /LENGTH=454 /DNA_ID=CAMNT_0004454293 /DNA_START=1082 /DNA_END=2446 /DNA_ORIENTATION=+
MDVSPQAVLEEQLSNPSCELSAAESVALVEHCVSLGEENAQAATGKEVVMVLGNTGAGKSTFLNYLLGCQMEAKRAKDLGLPGKKRVIRVAPTSNIDEVMPIGHGGASKTFMPTIMSDLTNADRVYCDCPGFSDNRGAEINMSNAVNIKRVLQVARDVKAIILASYSSMFSDRSASLRSLNAMCCQLFGGPDSLIRYQNSLFLGITQAPLRDEYDDPTSLDAIKDEICSVSNSETMQILANRSFLYDPLNRGAECHGFWSRGRCLKEISHLRSIPRTASMRMFQTVLDNNDQIKLRDITRHQSETLRDVLDRDDYASAECCWRLVDRLRIIGHEEVDKTLHELCFEPMKGFIIRRIALCKEYALSREFDDAKQQLNGLRRLSRHLPEILQPVLGLSELENQLRECEEKYEAVKRASEREKADMQRRLDEATKKVEKLYQERGDAVKDPGCCIIS